MLTVKDPIRYQLVLESMPMPRKEVARFLGIDFGQVSRDCNLLGIQPRKPLELHEIYAVWLIRLEIIRGTDRRELRELVKSEYGREEIARIQSERLKTPEVFLDELLSFITYNRPLALKNPEPEALKKRRRSLLPRISQRLAASILKVSQSTISRFARELGKVRGLDKGSFEFVFAELVLFRYLRFFKPRASRSSLNRDPDRLDYLCKLTNKLGLTNDIARDAFDAAIEGVINPIETRPSFGKIFSTIPSC